VPNHVVRSLVPAVVVAGALLGACSAGSPATVGEVMPLGSDAAGSYAPGANPDAGDNFTFTMRVDAGGPLEAHIQVNGGGAACGSCAVVVAQAQGGTQPYAYTWSDPSWNGPGPFTVCPTQDTPISVEVAGAVTNSGEGTMSSAVVKASTTIDCVPSDGAAGSGVGPLNGCQAHATSSLTADGGTDDSGVECKENEVDASAAWASGGVAFSDSSMLPYTLLKGHTYQVSYDQLLPIELGSAVLVDIYGATQANVCSDDDLLFTLTLDGSISSWHQSHCFTPGQDYDYLVTNVHIQDVLGYFNPLSVSTLCDTCSLAPGDE
jgi:hypothetical protein